MSRSARRAAGGMAPRSRPPRRLTLGKRPVGQQHDAAVRQLLEQAEVSVEQLRTWWRWVPGWRNYVYGFLFLLAVAARLADAIVLDGINGCCYTLACLAEARRELPPICSELPEMTYLGPIAVALLVMVSDFLVRCFRILRPGRPAANHWVAAASREYFVETVQAITRLHEIIACWIFLGCSLKIAFQAYNQAKWMNSFFDRWVPCLHVIY